jgi:hypothetical protein
MLQATLHQVDDGHVRGRARQAIQNLSVVFAVQFGFTNPPKIEMRYTGSAGRILNIAQATHLGMINSQIANVLVLPNRMVVPMDLGRDDFLETYQTPVGVVRLSALCGRASNGRGGSSRSGRSAQCHHST